MPIVEPEVLMDGDHDIDALRGGHRRWMLKETFQELFYAKCRARRHRAQAEHDRAGQEEREARASVEEVAERP